MAFIVNEKFSDHIDFYRQWASKQINFTFDMLKRDRIE